MARLGLQFNLLISCLLSCSISHASGYGIYDARALALGGTSVAISSTDNAYYYNPSLLAYHYEDEDNSNDGRIYTPSFVAQYSTAVKSAFTLVSDEVDSAFNNAIDLYNTTPTAEAAADALVFAIELEELVEEIQDKNLNIDSYVGIGISEVGELGGGSFFLGSRIIGGGSTAIPDADRQLFDDYVSTLEFIASNGQQGSNNPTLRDPDGSFSDPADRFNSSASFVGGILTEVGVSTAKLFHWKGLAIAVGATPKIMMLKAFDESRQVADDTFNVDSTRKPHLFLNLDAGITLEYQGRYRIAVAVKDLVEKKFTTALNNSLSLQPRYRLGFNYAHEYFSIGSDVDLNKSVSFAGEPVRQDISLGVEIPLLKLSQLRLGYRHDLEDNYKEVLSLGFGFGWRFVFTELAYAKSSDEESAALQFGFAF